MLYYCIILYYVYIYTLCIVYQCTPYCRFCLRSNTRGPFPWAWYTAVASSKVLLKILWFFIPRRVQMASSRHYKQFAWQRERQKRPRDYSVLTGTTPACSNGDKNDNTVVFVSVRTVRERVRGPCSYNCMSTGHAHAHALFERRQKRLYLYNAIAIGNSVSHPGTPLQLITGP